MKALKITLLCSLVSLSAFVVYHFQSEEQKQYFQGDDSLIRYVGRFDFSERHAPKVWAPGAYLECHIYGKKAVLIVEDEQKFGNLHNYIEVIVDGHLKRIRLKGKMNRIVLFHQKQATQHNVIVCKNTESAIGYIQIHGIECGRLLKVKKRKHLFEFIGDSITCGNGADSTQLSFGKGSWYDYHNAYLSFGARLARAFHADWMLSAVSGIGMNHSCCGLKHSMPEVYEFLDFHVNSDKWKFREQPACVFITLGQNDGTKFMSNYEHAYVAFLTILRKKYPHAWFICCTSPMADRSFRNSMKASIQRIITRRKASGEKRIIPFIYQGTYTAGYDKHPTIAQHAMMMQELRRFLMEQNSVTHLNEIVF
jgi:hypothetical protein